MTRNQPSLPLSRPAATAGSSLSSPDRVAASIMKGLLRREFEVGQRLIEADLTESLGVSRSTVREALKILAVHGVVEIIPHRGALIRGLSLADAQKLLDVLEVLTGLAARLAARNIGSGKNRQLLTQAAAAVCDVPQAQLLERILDERARFYRAIFLIADNKELDRATPSWQAHVFRSQFFRFLTKDGLTAMAREYRGIAAAILEGDEARAETQTRRHFQKTRERTMPHLLQVD